MMNRGRTLSISMELIALISGFTTMICGGAVSLVLTLAQATPNYEELKNVMVPLVSGAFFCVGVMLFNPEKETIRVTAARFIVSLPVGCTVPHILSIWKPTIFGMWTPPWEEMTNHAIILIPYGGLSTAALYLLSFPFFKGAYSRSRATAEMALNELDRATRAQRINDVQHVMSAVVKRDVIPVINERTNDIKAGQAQPQQVAEAVAEKVLETAKVAAADLVKAAKETAKIKIP